MHSHQLPVEDLICDLATGVRRGGFIREFFSLPVRASPVPGVVRDRRILKIQASLTAHWHDKGADWRGLAHTPAHEKERKQTSNPKEGWENGGTPPPHGF